MITFFLNGKQQVYQGDPLLPLIKILRHDHHITSAKEGCGQGYCGSCLVHVDGRPTLACVTPMKRINGTHVITTEGLDAHIQEVFTHAFAEKGGIQCGFCTPGIVMNAAALLKSNLNPTREELTTILNRNLCRCTGYIKIIDSILYAAAILRGEIKIPEGNPKKQLGVGGCTIKYTSPETVLGWRPFVADMYLENMHYGALKFSDHPRAMVKKIDLTEAQKINGVVKIFTAQDIPGVRKTGLIIEDWPLMIAEGEETHYVGDVLALVVAKEEAVAIEAAKKIQVQYEILSPVVDVDEAIKPEAPQIHQNGNVLSVCNIKRGDLEQAQKNSAYITEGIYNTQRIEHGFLEPECCLAVPSKTSTSVNSNITSSTAKLTIYSQGQGAYEDRKQIAKILGLSLNEVRVIQVQNGGGFGGKEDLTVQGHAALAAYHLGVPVKVTLTREESLIMHPKRHPIRMKYKVGCDKNGKLTFLTADMVGDSGAYASVGMKVLERAAGHAAGAYQVPVVDITAKAICTNNVPCGAMRGFGVNQATFAIEGCIDELCKQGGFDRWQFRYNNALTNGSMCTTGQILEQGVGVQETLLKLKEVFQKAKYAGIACGIKNCGVGNGMADIGRMKIEIASANKIIIHHGWTEMGQGVHTMAIQFLAEEIGQDTNLDLSQVSIEVKVDTENDVVCGMTTSSRATSLVGHAMKVAARELIADLKRKNISELVGKIYSGEWVCDWTTKPGKEKAGEKVVTHYSYSYSTQVAILNEKGDVEHVYVAQDAGKIINPTLFAGQIEGSVHMGLGYALTEDFPYKDGRPLFTRFHKCGILKAKDMPEVTVIGVEVNDRFGPHGAKGVGEIGMVPTAAAVANAFSEFHKYRQYSLPLKKLKGTRHE